MWALFQDASEYFPPLITSLNLFEIIYGGLTTCRQGDLKCLIAYSSGAHMGLVTLGFFCHTIQGLVAAIQGLVAAIFFMSSWFSEFSFIYSNNFFYMIDIELV